MRRALRCANRDSGVPQLPRRGLARVGAAAGHVARAAARRHRQCRIHAHPGPEYSVITKGTVALQTGSDCVVTQYGAGQAVFIPAGVAHRVANDSAQDVEVVATYTVPAEVTVREDAPDACAK